jgi:pimeloyl-ACP methyl ester carboxylesterase
MVEIEADDVTLVGNDTGGALCQLVAAQHPERIGRLVLTDCDAYDNFLPLAFRYLQALARLPGGIGAVAQVMRAPIMRRSPIAYGWLTKNPIEDELIEDFVGPVIGDRDVRRDVAKVLRGISKRHTLEAAEQLRHFDRPTLIAWGNEDRFFPAEHAERLASSIPNARLVMLDDARSFLPLDQPRRLAQLIEELIAPSG